MQSYYFVNPEPYRGNSDTYITVQFVNRSTIDDDSLYFCTVLFDEGSSIREDVDFIAFYKDSSETAYFGNEQYTGSRLPGANGEPALGIRAASLYFHFRTGFDLVAPGNSYGYGVTFTFTRYSNPNEVPLESGTASPKALGISAPGLIGLLVGLVFAAIISMCCVCFWYLRAKRMASKRTYSEVTEKKTVILYGTEWNYFVLITSISLITCRKIKLTRRNMFSRQVPKLTTRSLLCLHSIYAPLVVKL